MAHLLQDRVSKKLKAKYQNKINKEFRVLHRIKAPSIHGIAYFFEHMTLYMASSQRLRLYNEASMCSYGVNVSNCLRSYGGESYSFSCDCKNYLKSRSTLPRFNCIDTALFNSLVLREVVRILT
jgi:hypothetical protein